MPSGTRKADRDEAFRSVLAQEPLVPGSETHRVFNNRDLSSTSGGQLRTTEITCNVLGVFWAALSNSKEGFSLHLV